MNHAGVFHPELWEKLRGVHSLGYPDACIVMPLTETYDAYNNTAENYDDTATAIPCRFFTGISVATAGYEMLAQSEVPRNSTWIAVPLGTDINPQARVRITKRQGATISPAEDYEVAAPVVIGTTALIVRLRPVDDYISP